MMTAFFILFCILFCICLAYGFRKKSKETKVISVEIPKNGYCKANEHKWRFVAWDIDYDVYKCEKCACAKQTKHYQ